MVITHQLGRAHVDYLFPTTPSNLEVPCRFPFVAPLFDCSKPMRDQYTPNLPWPPLIRTSTSLVGLDIHRTLYHILWASLKQLNVKATCFSFDCCGHPPSPEPWGAYGLSYNPCGSI